MIRPLRNPVSIRVQFQCVSCGYLDDVHMTLEELPEWVDKVATCPQCHQQGWVAWVQLELPFST